jgi:hypothetical protein
MELPRYQISTNEDQTVFWFTSQGPKGNIVKLVIYTPMNELGVYNLALGDFDPKTNHTDFESVTNNSDRDKVLASVVDTVYGFFAHKPNLVLHFKGSDKARTRLYQMAIANFIEELSKDFDVFGKLNGKILRFTKGINYDAFLIQLKKES